jgi:hypothetical protein
MKMRALGVTIIRAFKDRPKREDVHIEDWEGPLISPSALTSYLACPRKWAFGALDGKYLPSTSSQALGQALHSQLEDWLMTGVPPIGRLTDSGALSLFPMPNTPGLECEQPFAVEISNDEGRRAVFWGFRDVAYPGGVMDLKTTSSLDWAKKPEELIKDPQANIYAAASMLESGLDHADLRWVYVTTRGTLASKPVDVRLTRDQVTARLSGWFDSVCYMSELRSAKTTRAITLEPQRKSCGDYGGCGFLSDCGEVPAGGGFLSLRRQTKEQQERHVALKEEETVGIMDKVRKDLGSWKTDELAARVPEVPVRPAQAQTPTQNPVVVAAPASPGGLLAKVKGIATPPATVAAPVSTGINAPDAKPPSVSEEPQSAAPAPSKSRGRPKKAKAVEAAETPEENAVAVEATPAPTTAPTTVAATSTNTNTALSGVVLFVDCTPVGHIVTDLSLGLSGEMTPGYYVVSSKYTDAETLRSYVRNANLIVRAN